MSDNAEPGDPPSRARPQTHLWPRLGLLQAVVLLAAVVIALPVAFRSMGILLTGGQARTLYDFPSGQPLTGPASEEETDAVNYFNIAAIDLDEAQGSITFAISGHRLCPDDASCATINFSLISLDDDADVRRALPPSASLTLEPDDLIFSQTIQLPIRGQPSQYPFDDYLLWLGLTGTMVLDDETLPLTVEMLEERAVITTQNQLRDYLMVPPVEIDPAQVASMTDPQEFVGVQQLRFERPAHQEILAVLLIALIAVSAIIAVALRTMSDLLIGIGSLILGIWGVRSVLVPSSLSVISSIDLALSVIILFVLLGLSLRVARHFQQQSELPPVTLRRRR
ncbi:MAG: hypothetical protein K0S78_151 [Thermomicrobiales bacterium]|jgi:hypothetical protein|nr:hypothetical protein [Thermomicrobiales bacterium]MDF3040363.1 hypothetical protein [Thermomicrobiales bacterium]